MSKPKHKKIYFDRADKEILQLVNRIIDGRVQTDSGLDPNLHPHGIKELVDTPVSRMAYAVASLLRNLETGRTQARDRLRGLQILYDEVLSSAHTSLRRNTARVLMQIMKNMVRAHGNEEEQLRLAHDFRAAAQGTPRVVRHLLQRYQLPEMSESWNQIAFDDHVYDMNTKGRKSPTHLIMDAWIKGLRTLTLVYDYCVDHDVAQEALAAAAIVGITLRIGLEFRVQFRKRFVSFLWIPRGFSSDEDFLAFLKSPEMKELYLRGREIVDWERELVLHDLEIWNNELRPEYCEQYSLNILPLSADDFLNFIGRGQANKARLAECINTMIYPLVEARLKELAKTGNDLDYEQKIQKQCLESICSDMIQREWLSEESHPHLSKVCLDEEQLPELLQLSPLDLMKELTNINAGYRMVLCTTGLTVQDVMELLWDCRGIITHLEIFNMRGWMEGFMANIHEIGELQHALNSGQGPRLKQMIRQMIRDMQESGDDERAGKFEKILRNVPTLWEHYRHVPLKSRIGTGSANRSNNFGMGLVVTSTLPRRGVKMLKERAAREPAIPIWADVEEHEIYRRSEVHGAWDAFLQRLSFLPGLHRLGCDYSRTWVSPRDNLQVSRYGNIANLGGLNSSFLKQQRAEKKQQESNLRYLNSTIVNILKILLGFVPAFISFQYTQDWWFLAWFGPIIWFSITGVRNVIQMVLAAKGLSRSTLIHWRDHVSINRLCDSLMYTGISVYLLEVLMRVMVLQNTFDVDVGDNPLLVFAALSIVNGLYICTHNVYRGFPRTAAIGNLFRSVLSIPIATSYNLFLSYLLSWSGIEDPSIYLVPSAAVISKMASDTVAAIIEGFADSRANMHMRHWDYHSKLQKVFDCYTRLELMFPQEDALIRLARPGGLKGRGGAEARRLERALIVNALDMMFIWYYQPRAQDSFKHIIRSMASADRTVLALSQLILMREREVSQLMVDGLVGRNFARPLAFFLSKRKEYVKAIIHLCKPGRSVTMRTHQVVFGLEGQRQY